MGLRNQFLATGVLCYVNMGMGMLYTWPSSTIVFLSSPNTTLSRPMTQAETSLFGSLSSIGALVSTPFSGFLLDKMGRKYLTLSICVMQLISWTILVAFNYVETALLFCILVGIGGAGFVVFGIYISEFCQQSIRGAMTSSPLAAYFLGMVMSYWIGGTLDYYTVLYISLSHSVAGIIMVSFLKESPVHLMAKGLSEEAAKSVAFFRNAKINSNEVQKELDAITRVLNADLEGNTAQDVKKLKPDSTTKQKLSTWQFIRKSSSTRRAFAVCFVIAVLSIFQGIAAILVYADPLFRLAVPKISSTLCAVLLAVTSCLSSLLASYLSDVVGRRNLLMFASLACGVMCILLGSQLQLLWGPYWLTPMFIFMYNLVWTLGSGTVPFVLLPELFLPEIKAIVAMLIMESIWVSNFVLLNMFGPLEQLMGLASVFYIFAVIGFILSAFTYLMLPETKGLAVDAIQLLFTSRSKSTVV